MSNIYRVATPPTNMKKITPCKKPFEARLNDTGLQAGDIVLFEEANITIENGERKIHYTGNIEEREIISISDRPAPRGLIWVTLKCLDYSNKFKSKEGQESCA